MFYIFIITPLILQIVVEAESVALNVRTTLFTPADLAKRRWNKREVALLRARMYFQALIPPMDVSQAPEYIRSLIRYIENCYAAIDQAAFDRETGTILTVAASDVFGGYLKMVALPVTKYAYYSGDIPTQDALKLFKYYEDIKDQLHTNGRGWSEELKNVVKPQSFRGVRSDLSTPKIRNPCKRLLYMNNNQQNVTMPMPSIDWNTRVMFVPVTNQPIVDLKSPHVSSVLQQFHQIATACERSISPERRYFQGTFEDWVNDAVVPHLNDDDLYTAFKGILSLIDNSNLISVPVKCEKHGFIKSMFHRMSKKTIVIAIILILELICCIPTLLYCVLKKKKKTDSKLLLTPTGSSSSINRNLPPKKIVCNDKTVFYELSSRSSSNQSPNRVTSRVHSINYKRFMKDKISSELSTASGSRRSYSSITDAVTTDEAPSIRKSSHEKILPTSQQSLRYKLTETEKIAVSQGQTQVSKLELLPRRSSTSTAIQNNTSNETGETITLSSILPQERSTSKTIRKSKRFRPRHDIESLSPKTYSTYPSLDNVMRSRENNVSNTVKELKLDVLDDRFIDIPLMRFNSEKTVEFLSPHASKTRTKNSEISLNPSMKSLRNASERESRRAIKIYDEHKRMIDSLEDRPRQQISAKVSRQIIQMDSDIMPQRKGILKSGEDRTRLKTKVSRIPKKINSPVTYCEWSVPRPKRREPEGRRKSMIPKLERALDDSALASSSPREDKLNVTL